MRNPRDYAEGVRDGLNYGVGFLIGSAASARELGKHDLAEVFTAAADELVGCSTVPGAQHCNALMDDGDTEHACCLGADHDDAAHECDCGMSWP